MDIAKLDGLQLFDGLSAQQREIVANYAVEVDVPEGKVLVRDGALAWDFYVIEEGSADVRRGQKVLATLGAGDFFGEMGAMASDRRRTASVVATSPMKAIRCTTHQLRRIADESPDITERLRSAIADRERRRCSTTITLPARGPAVACRTSSASAATSSSASQEDRRTRTSACALLCGSPGTACSATYRATEGSVTKPVHRPTSRTHDQLRPH